MTDKNNTLLNHLHDIVMPESDWARKKREIEANLCKESIKGNVSESTPLDVTFLIIMVSCAFCFVVSVVLMALQNLSSPLVTEILKYAHQYRKLIAIIYYSSAMVIPVTVICKMIVRAAKYERQRDNPDTDYDEQQSGLDLTFMKEGFCYVMITFFLVTAFAAPLNKL